jgi:hypothetical protein
MQSRPKYRRMRRMLRLQWSASPRRLAIALVIGAVATAATTRLPLHLVDRGHGGQIRTVHRGVHAWWHARDHAWGLRWSNLQLIDPPLSTPVWEGELHGWEEPPAPPYPAAQIYRVGTLASGWPLPVLWMRWSETDLRRPFPVPAEVDDGDLTIWNATDSALHGTRGGPPKEKRILWLGAAANTILYAAVLVGPVALVRRALRGDFTRRAGAAAAR